MATQNPYEVDLGRTTFIPGFCVFLLVRKVFGVSPTVALDSYAGRQPVTGKSSLSWNPQDGGTFEKLIARLTIDKKGKRGDEPGFDKANIKTYGIAGTGAGGDGFGQIQWASFTGSNGWQATDKNPWGTKSAIQNVVIPRFGRFPGR